MNSAWIEALTSAEAFPHAAHALQLIETHISWVVLAGEFAYKIKKPIRTSFLDYSSAEARQRYCRAELKLNRRFAPEIYLDVVPITRSAEGIRIQGTGEVIEHAVLMWRFPADALMSRRLAEGRVSTEQVRALAFRLARFHQSAQSVNPNLPYGSADVVYKEALDNCRDILKSPLMSALGSERVAAVEAIRKWTDETFETHRALFELRKEQGHVRECHGDLHLGNLVWWQDQFIPFDGIEFSEEFRWIDTFSDLGFLAMDLMASGRADLSHSVINAYLEFSGDYAAVQVMKWYLVFRAMVRAKVAGLRAVQLGPEHGPEHDLYEDAIQDLSRHLSLAVRLAQGRQTTPRLWITHGVSGSGKTVGSEAIVQREGAIRIRSDVERKRRPLASAELYLEEVTERTYQRLAQIAEQLIRSGENVIVDATFLSKDKRDLFRAVADRCQAIFRIVPFTADEATLVSRLAERKRVGQDVSDADVNVLKQQLRSLQPLEADERRYVEDS